MNLNNIWQEFDSEKTTKQNKKYKSIFVNESKPKKRIIKAKPIDRKINIVAPVKIKKVKIKIYNFRPKPRKNYYKKVDSYTRQKLQTRLFDFIKSEFKNFNIVQEYRPIWLGRQMFDIYLPDYNIAIEYQGKQHFTPIDYFGGQDSFIIGMERDERKRQLSTKNNCTLLYFTYTAKDVPKNYKFKVFTCEQEIKEFINLKIMST